MSAKTILLRLGGDDWMRLNEDRYCIYNGGFNEQGERVNENEYWVLRGGICLDTFTFFEAAVDFLRDELVRAKPIEAP